MKHIILFNAPPASGKDYAVSHLLGTYEEACHLRFKDQLYKEAAHYADVDVWWLMDIATDRNTKDEPCSKLPNNMTPRQWLIHVSEKIIKPLYGKDYFGKQLAKAVEDEDVDLIFVSDCGFKEEVKAVIDNCPNHEVHVIQIYSDGCSFVNDSRNYIDIYGRTHIIHNYKDERFIPEVTKIVSKIIGEK